MAVSNLSNIADPKIAFLQNLSVDKKRLAFLDLLIEASEDGKVLSDKDIRGGSGHVHVRSDPFQFDYSRFPLLGTRHDLGGN